MEKYEWYRKMKYSALVQNGNFLKAHILSFRVVHSLETGPLFSYNLRYIVGFDQSLGTIRSGDRGVSGHLAMSGGESPGHAQNPLSCEWK